MSSPFTSSMFESLKSALNKESESSNNQFKDLLKLKPGNTYTVRLLPNLKSTEDTFHHYFSFGWNSLSTGKYFSVVSPSTWNQRCPIAEERARIYRTGTAEEKEKSAVIRRREEWLVNVYVINDPVNPENNGKVKVLRYGKQLHKIIDEAIRGEEAEEFGPRIFDLSKNGCDFKIKVEEQGAGNDKYPTYVSSKFSSPKEIKGLADSEHQAIYDSVIDLKTLAQVKSYDELKTILNEHFHCTKQVVESEEAAETPEPSKSAKTESKEPVTVDVDDVDELLKDLDTD